MAHAAPANSRPIIRTPCSTTDPPVLRHYSEWRLPSTRGSAAFVEKSAMKRADNLQNARRVRVLQVRFPSQKPSTAAMIMKTIAAVHCAQRSLLARANAGGISANRQEA